MKAILFIALFVSCAFAAREAAQPAVGFSGLSFAEIQRINELRQTKWGSIFISLAEMQMAAGPMDRLLQALDDLVKELGKTQDDENNRFAQKQATHEATITGLNQQVNEVNGEINSNKLKIESVLKPRLAAAQAQIERDSVLITQKQEEIKNAQENRLKEHAEFEQRVKDHTLTIAAVDECIGLVSSLLSGTPTMLQIKKATISLKNLENKVRLVHFSDTPMVQALIALVASQNFSDQSSVNKVLSLLQDFRARLVKSQETEQFNEQQAQDNFVKYLAQLNTEIVNLKADIQNNTVVIEDTKKEINDCLDIITRKTFELQDLKDRIAAENEAWRKECVAHQEIIDEINREVDVVKQCRQLFASKSFSNYVSGHMEHKTTYFPH